MSQPDKCPRCNSDNLHVCKFTNYNDQTDKYEGSYYCEKCGWEVNATTGDKVI